MFVLFLSCLILYRVFFYSAGLLLTGVYNYGMFIRCLVLMFILFWILLMSLLTLLT